MEKELKKASKAIDTGNEPQNTASGPLRFGPQKASRLNL